MPFYRLHGWTPWNAQAKKRIGRWCRVRAGTAQATSTLRPTGWMTSALCVAKFPDGQEELIRTSELTPLMLDV